MQKIIASGFLHIHCIKSLVTQIIFFFFLISFLFVYYIVVLYTEFEPDSPFMHPILLPLKSSIKGYSNHI